MTIDTRPPIRLLLRNTDGELDLIGSLPFGLFESLPAACDVLLLPSPVGDDDRALVVRQRYFSARMGEPAWWLVLESTNGEEWLAVAALEGELAELYEERAGEVSESLQKLTAKPKRPRKSRLFVDLSDAGESHHGVRNKNKTYGAQKSTNL